MAQQRPRLQMPWYALEPAYKAYLPKELIPAYVFSDRGLSCDSAAYPKTDIYGSSQELLRKVQNFLDFPSGYTKFGIEPIYAHITKPNKHKSLEKKEYVYKQEMFIHLFEAIPRITFGQVENHFIFSVIAFFMNTKENQLQNVFELVPFDAEKLKAFEEKTLKKLQNLKNFHPKSDEKLKPTLNSFFSELKKMLPSNVIDPEYKCILKVLEEFNYEKPVKKNLKLYKDIIKWIRTIIEELNNFIEENPKWFLPKSECAQNPEDPIIIRVFDSRAQKSVMEYELLGLLDKLDAAEIKQMFETRGIVRTIEFNEVLRRLGEKAKNIEFVVVFVKMSEYAAPVFNPLFDGKHCILGSDFLSDVLRDMASIKKVFQKINNSNWKIIIELFEKLHDVFDCNMEKQYYIETDKAAEVKAFCSKYLKEHMEDLLKDTKDVRKVGRNGFTLDDLKNEILYLGIDGAFPGIFKYTEHAYRMVNHQKQAGVLRTCDMYTALEECQYIGLFSRIPKFLQFSHLQKVCEYSSIICTYCSGKTKVTKIVSGYDVSKKSKDTDDVAPIGSK